MFEAIATSAKRLLGGFAAAVFRFIDGTVHLAAFTPVSPAADAALKADFPKPVDDFEAFRLARHGKPFPIPDTEEMPHTPIREIARLHGFRSMLFVPLMNGGVPIGIISVTRREPGAFSPHHIQLLQTFADQAVIAIENVRLFNEVQATHQRFERIPAAADRRRRRPQDHQPLDLRSAAGAGYVGQHRGAVMRCRDGLHSPPRRRRLSGRRCGRLLAGVYRISEATTRFPSNRGTITGRVALERPHGADLRRRCRSRIYDGRIDNAGRSTHCAWRAAAAGK